MLKHLRLLVFCLGILMASSLHAADSGFRQVDATLIVNGKAKGVMLLEWFPGKGPFHFPGPLVLMALSDLIPDRMILILDTKLTEAGFLTSDDLRKLGIGVEYSEGKSELRLSYTAAKGVSKSALKDPNLPAPKAGPEKLAPSAYRQDTMKATLNDSLDFQAPFPQLPESGSANETHHAKPMQNPLGLQPLPAPESTAVVDSVVQLNPHDPMVKSVPGKLTTATPTPTPTAKPTPATPAAEPPVTNAVPKSEVGPISSEPRSEPSHAPTPVPIPAPNQKPVTASPPPIATSPVPAKVDSSSQKPTQPLIATSPVPTKVDSSSLKSADSSAGKPIISTYSYPESKEALFKSVFKTAPPAIPVDVEVSLMVDGTLWGKVWIKLTTQRDEFFLPLENLNQALEGRVSSDILKKLSAAKNKDGSVSGKSILAQGIVPTLKVNEFELNLQLPSQLLATLTHNLSSSGDAFDEADYDKPAFISGYLNTRLKQLLQYKEISANADLGHTFASAYLKGKNENFRPPWILDLDGSINLNGVVLESRGTYAEPQKGINSELIRNDIRMVYDQPKQAIRYTAGDLLFPTTGYQSVLKMGGFGAARDFSLQPNLVVYPTKDYDFYLENQAEVRVYVNSTLISSLILEAGSHSLQGIPLSTGESEIKIEILDATGRTQTVVFNFIHETALLAKGRSTFSGNIGYPGQRYPLQKNFNLENENLDFLGYRYILDKLITSLAYQRGMTDVLTAGLYTQSLQQDGLVGLNFTRAFPIGTAQADFAFSKTDSLGKGFAANINYANVPKPTETNNPISWRVKGEYLSENFSRIQTSLFRSTQAWIFSFGLGKNLDIIDVNLGGGYSINRSRKDVYNLSLGAHKNLSKGFSGNMIINHFFDQYGIANTNFTAVFSYNFSSGVNNFSAGQRFLTHPPEAPDTTSKAIQAPPPKWDNSTDITWDYNSSAPFPNNPKITGSVSLAPTYNDYSIRTGFRGNQGMLEINGRRNEPGKNYGNIVENQLEFVGQTSLVFVNGRFGLSRPVQNGFVLAKGVKNLKHTDITVNQFEIGYDAQSNNFGPAVLPSLFPYSAKTVRISTIDAPLGSSLEKSIFYLYPRYRSGFLIEVGTDGDVVAMGTFNDKEGKPLEYKVLNLFSIDNPKLEPLKAFTNASGRFQFPSMRPGKWRLEAVDLGSTTFVIPKGTIGIFQLGELKIDPAK